MFRSKHLNKARIIRHHSHQVNKAFTIKRPKQAIPFKELLPAQWRHALLIIIGPMT